MQVGGHPALKWTQHEDHSATIAMLIQVHSERGKHEPANPREPRPAEILLCCWKGLSGQQIPDSLGWLVAETVWLLEQAALLEARSS